LPAWTGNEPEKLASYYSDDCLYLDPEIPDGLNGKNELIGEVFKGLQIIGGVGVIATIILLQLRREHDDLSPERRRLKKNRNK